MEGVGVKLNKVGPNILASQPLLQFTTKEDKENPRRTGVGGVYSLQANRKIMTLINIFDPNLYFKD